MTRGLQARGLDGDEIPFAVAVRTALFIRAWRYHTNRGKILPTMLRRPSGANDIISGNITRARYDGAAVLFKAELRTLLDPDVHDGWQKIIRDDLETRQVHGRHSDQMIEPTVCDLVAEQNDCIKMRFG